MCYAVDCRECGKTTWTGCGQHVDQVMKSVPEAKRCQGHQQRGGRVRGVFSRLLG